MNNGLMKKGTHWLIFQVIMNYALPMTVMSRLFNIQILIGVQNPPCLLINVWLVLTFLRAECLGNHMDTLFWITTLVILFEFRLLHIGSMLKKVRKKVMIRFL